jgi:hypothetical protein
MSENMVVIDDTFVCLFYIQLLNFLARFILTSNVHFVLITNLTHFFNVFISLLYMLRAPVPVAARSKV